MRCLIVEDDRSLAELVRLELGDHGVEAVCLGSIAAAIEAVRAAPPDALVLDLGLPDGCGLDVAREAGRLRPSAPTLVFTGSEDADALAIFRDHGNVRAVMAKRAGRGGDVGAVVRSLISMMHAETAAGPRMALDGGQVGAGGGDAGRSPGDRAAMAAAVRKAAGPRSPSRLAGGKIRSVRPAASGGGRPILRPLRA